ncbi:hypothetical protein [Vulcanisaeta sp. JCM 14467]|uniref:hypothetical protein n=1 Tax=Vulcanisaeta sp. JCM 14467 TaxID=1295370 RepID=UPI0006CFCE7C|nr:hypothetical protein [Vulcanisaeta sp. JCM 14467]
MPEVHEEVINVKLANILSRELGIDARAERIHGRRRPDIRCYYRGFIIGIEASYSASDAEEDARGRIEQGLTDISVALWIKERFKDIPESQLYDAIKRPRFDVKVFVPSEIKGTLIPFIESKISKKAEPVTEWFKDVDIPTLKLIIESSIDFLVREEEIKRNLEFIEEKINDFTESLKALDNKGIIRRRIYDILYRLYGLSVAKAENPDVAFGHAALSILLSSTFYEHVRSMNPELRSLSNYIRQHGGINGLRRALEDLLKVDYKVVIETTLNILDALPQDIDLRVKDLIELGAEIAAKRSLLRKDFAGRVYHRITGDIAVRKGFATFYTEVPAAYLLASLAVQFLLNLDMKDPLTLSRDEAHNLINRIRSVKIGDFACGSGTLLTASYSALMRLIALLKYYYDVDVDLNNVGKELIENGIYGIDALKYASQITAINLALIGPEVISRENVFTIYLGLIPGKQQAWFGSLELLNNGKRVGGILAYIEGGLKGSVERVNVEGVEGVFSLPEKFDLIIMNPPFTRPTGRTERFGERRGLFGLWLTRMLGNRLLMFTNMLELWWEMS